MIRGRRAQFSGQRGSRARPELLGMHAQTACRGARAAVEHSARLVHRKGVVVAEGVAVVAPASRAQLRESALRQSSAHTPRGGRQTPAAPCARPAEWARCAPVPPRRAARSRATSAVPSRGPVRSPTSLRWSWCPSAASSRDAGAPRPAIRLQLAARVSATVRRMPPPAAAIC